MKTRNLSHRFADVLAIPRVPTWQRQVHVATDSRRARSARQQHGYTLRRSASQTYSEDSATPRMSTEALLRHSGDPRFRRLRSAA
jgi:hypothetical protein